MPHLQWKSLAAVGALHLAPCLIGILPAAAVADETLEVVYLANEGFLLRAGATTVLIDAVFGEGLFGYDVLSGEERRKLETGLPPYDGVDLVLASHFHGDHFNAPAMARLLEANPEAEFVSTAQAVDKLLAVDDQLAARARGLVPNGADPVHLRLGEVGLTVFDLHHGRGRPRVENLGLLVEICGVRVLHTGDTEANSEEMAAAGLQDLAPDAALLPSWYLRPGRWMAATERVLRAGRLVAMHLPTAEAPESYFWGGVNSRQELAAAIKADFTDAFVPMRTGDSISLRCR